MDGFPLYTYGTSSMPGIPEDIGSLLNSDPYLSSPLQIDTTNKVEGVLSPEEYISPEIFFIG